MINTRKIGALLLAAVMVFALAGCNKKVLDADDFEDVLEDFDYEVTTVDDAYLGKNEEERLTAYDEDYDYVAYFVEFEEKEDAIEEFEDVVDDVRDAKEDNDYDGSIKTSKSGNYNKCVLNGEFDDEVGEFPEGNIYAVMYRIGNIGFIVMAFDNDAKEIKEVNDIVNKLGY